MQYINKYISSDESNHIIINKIYEIMGKPYFSGFT